MKPHLKYESRVDRSHCVVIGILEEVTKATENHHKSTLVIKKKTFSAFLTRLSLPNISNSIAKNREKVYFHSVFALNKVLYEIEIEWTTSDSCCIYPT